MRATVRKGLAKMLKITVNGCSKHPKICLDGKLAGDWVSELESVWKDLIKDRPAQELTLVLSGVTFADAKGMRLLGSMLGKGAKLQEPQSLVEYMLKEFQPASN